MQTLERVLNAACTMYTTEDNLEHTIQIQEELFRQRLRLQGMDLKKKKTTDDGETSSEHFYDNIDSETSDFERRTLDYQNRTAPWYQKKQQRTVRFCLNHQDEEQKNKTGASKVKCNDQYYSLGKRKTGKLSSKLITNKKSSCPHSQKLVPTNLLTVTIT